MSVCCKSWRCQEPRAAELCALQSEKENPSLQSYPAGHPGQGSYLIVHVIMQYVHNSGAYYIKFKIARDLTRSQEVWRDGRHSVLSGLWDPRTIDKNSTESSAEYKKEPKSGVGWHVLCTDLSVPGSKFRFLVILGPHFFGRTNQTALCSLWTNCILFGKQTKVESVSSEFVPHATRIQYSIETVWQVKG